MARFQMALHGGYRVTYQAKRHVPVRRRLVLNEHVNVAVTTGGFQAVETSLKYWRRSSSTNEPDSSFSVLRSQMACSSAANATS
jgi:hypothetical protein